MAASCPPICVEPTEARMATQLINALGSNLKHNLSIFGLGSRQFGHDRVE
jgi:hypothetical protein